ncbi:MAG: bifunctional 4-hydroxy-3-methylbut-2-enyl diphosphate reductase/30S ribosomal protein S1 [Oscillospiraceae bacterium]|nr:bifunctional 4-hydroxy-3-methylbut-2-enyl diphosphate reductase/30S ribosomal protein S1 [Oscillospiraceae bacterium]
MKFQINVAENAGFCFGVDRAVKIVYNILNGNKKAVCFGEIIHNPNVVADLEEKGVRVIHTPEEIDSLEDTAVVIRSHGVGEDIYRRIKAREAFGVECCDGTCPFVKRIHKIVSEKTSDGYDIIIMGDENHPEVQGIVGFCKNKPIICSDDAQLLNFLKKNLRNLKKKVAIVAQTTYNINMWDKCSRMLSAEYPEAEIYNTICSATEDRQKSAVSLAQSSDFMVVIGGRHSSNTVKLFDICRKYCESCMLVSDAGELGADFLPDRLNNTGKKINIGITAGASTPAYIIKEVKHHMSEILKNNDEDFNFEEALDASFKKIYTGNRVKGYITAVNNSEAVVDVGTKHTGYIALSELTDDPTLKPADVVKVGDEVDLIVIKINDAEGIVQLSKKKVDAMVGFDNLVKAKAEDKILEGTVTQVVKGGVIAVSEGTRVFIPASQATARRDEKLDALLKKNVKFKIIEIDENKLKAVGSIKVVLNAEKDAAKAKFWESVNVNDKFKGEVKSITNYGAFVDLGGIDGMVHISELSWNRIKHPSEVVKVGDVIEVFVKELDAENNRISLGYKSDDDNPWVKFANSYKVDDVVDAKVVSITTFGAFAQIIPGIDGLIHISQLADKRVTNVKDVVAVGDEVKAKITEIDIDKKRISMSIRALLTNEEAADDEAAE